LADGTDVLIARMNAARDTAISYEASGDCAYAHGFLMRYASLAAELAESGAVSAKEAELAAAWRDSLAYEPSVIAGDPSKKGIFFGGDGVFAEGSSAVKLDVPYGADVAGFFPMIPSSIEETGVLVSLSPTNEKTLRTIAQGKADDYMIDFVRKISRIEGVVYLDFCPAVNTWRMTRTIEQSFIDAFRYVAHLADRYAPNVRTVFSLADLRKVGEDTVALFWPGNEYVDVFGAEVYYTYNRSEAVSPEAALDLRGEYFDPVASVARLADDAVRVSGDAGLPVIVTGCSFPWGGRAATDGWAFEMERFYTLIPGVCPTLEAVFYTNVSSAYAFCNLRQNGEAFEVYRRCLSLPWYREHGSGKSAMGAVPVCDLGYLPEGKSVPVYLYAPVKYSDAVLRLSVDGVEIDADRLSFTSGVHVLVAYAETASVSSMTEYTVNAAKDGTLTIEKTPFAYDYNGNGILDTGDASILLAYVTKWDVSLGDGEPDVNGDGKVNLKDVSVLRGFLQR